MPCYAHTLGERKEDWEPLREHLLRVAARAEGFAAALRPGGAGAFGRALGLLHDAGKYAEAFQRYLDSADGRGRVDHSSAGAVLALERYGRSLPGWLLAYAVAGHHAGLPDGTGGEPGCLTRRVGDGAVADPARPGFAAEVMHLLPAELPVPPLADPFRAALFARMLFSCLTDADALATQGFTDPDMAALRGGRPDLATLAAALRLHLNEKAREGRDSPVGPVRAEVLARCRAAAERPPGVFSLAVPTGGGKTLSSLAFALEHALRHGLRRVIYVIPYLSIIEQTAEVFRREAFAGLPDAVLEHHSAFRHPDGEEGIGPDRHKLAAENWDAPVVVTTAVQFFESLFAARPSRCRKLHNIAGSVIVLDEAQLLPVPHLRPCLAALQGLVADYGGSVVLCTATQPALGRGKPLEFGFDAVHAIVPEVAALDLHARMRRVRVEHAGWLDDDALAARMAGAAQALCVLDTRGHAADLFRALKAMGVEGVRHLSAAMCAEHRSAVLAGIRADLAAGRPCRVVSTQLVEAGVDVDFPLVLRAMAGLDSIAQSAGRCNREGRLAEGGTVVVFESERRNRRMADLNRRRDAAEEALDGRDWAEALEPGVLSAYFRLLYRTGKGQLTADAGDPFDQTAAWSKLGKWTKGDAIPFRDVEKKFHLIDDDQVAVITPYTDEAKGWTAALRTSKRPGALARKLQRHTVLIPKNRVDLLTKAEVIKAVGEQWQFLLLANPNAYDQHLGLEVRDPRQRSEFENIP